MERLGYAADVNSWGPGSTMCNRSQEIAMRTHLLLPLLGLLSLCPASSAAAQSEAAGSYPERPVKVIVPYAAGAAADVIGRIVAQKLSEHTGTQFYVENLPGAGGRCSGRRSSRLPRLCTRPSRPSLRGVTQCRAVPAGGRPLDTLDEQFAR